jgi:hypothetical protein
MSLEGQQLCRESWSVRPRERLEGAVLESPLGPDSRYQYPSIYESRSTQQAPIKLGVLRLTCRKNILEQVIQQNEHGFRSKMLGGIESVHAGEARLGLHGQFWSRYRGPAPTQTSRTIIQHQHPYH